jgi:hypothetical protein
MTEYKAILLRLALSDESFVDSVLGMGRDTVEVSCLPRRDRRNADRGRAYRRAGPRRVRRA